MVDRTTYPDGIVVPDSALRQVFGRQRLSEKLMHSGSRGRHDQCGNIRHVRRYDRRGQLSNFEDPGRR